MKNDSKNVNTMEYPFNPEDKLDYMFDIPEPYCNLYHIMLSHSLHSSREFRKLLYEEDLTKLNDFSVIENIHAEWFLGTYIVHNDWVEKPFIKSDDFILAFTIKDYIERKKIRELTKEINFLDELERFKTNDWYDWYKSKTEDLNLKTKWTIVTYDDKPIALISEQDSWRLPTSMSREIHVLQELEKRYKKFRVQSLQEGVEYLKMF